MSEDTERHAMKMAKKKAARDKIMATKTDKKGLIIVHTGKGKGKSTAAFGMIFRHIAHGMQSAVVQFIKGGMSTGERDMILDRFTDICSFIQWEKVSHGKHKIKLAILKWLKQPGQKQRI